MDFEPEVRAFEIGRVKGCLERIRTERWFPVGRTGGRYGVDGLFGDNYSGDAHRGQSANQQQGRSRWKRCPKCR